MSKKFDVVIGNPPYQEEAQGEGTRATPLYHRFVEAAYEVGRKAVLITPARFLFDAGFTPKAWNAKMLADSRLTVPHYEPNSDELFPGTVIKGGIAVTYWDEDHDGEPITIFTSAPELNAILQKVLAEHGPSIAPTVSSGRDYAYTPAMHNGNPEASAQMSSDAQFRVSTNAFSQLAFLYRSEPPEGEQQEFVRVYGLAGRARVYRWIRSEYLTGPASFEAYKVALPKANGSGTFGEVLSNPVVIDPEVAVTQTFITIGSFEDKSAADACLKYVKTKFARALLGVLKSTQDNPARVWKYVPMQDFTRSSDIDWARPIGDIDQQLYGKYGLDSDEIEYVEAAVQPMA